ncbi:MAG: LamG domain-containing protein [Euryarchaeota archaeon]|nr:LamG domain-containing protein [Euryarchaeota archaeon]
MRSVTFAVMIAALMLVPIAPAAPTTDSTYFARFTGGEVAVWQFDVDDWHPEFGQTWDSTSNINDLTISNAPYAPFGGRFGGAFNFNGVNSFLSRPNPPSLNGLNQVTVMAWVEPTFTKTAGGAGSGIGISGIVNNVAAIGTTGGYALRIGDNTSGVPEFLVYSSAPLEYRLVGKTPLSAGVAYHIAGTFDGSTMRLYVNGMLDGSRSGTLSSTSASFEIGRDLYSNNRVFPGVIDEVRVYNRALLAGEIVSLMNCPYDNSVVSVISTPSC